MDKRKNERINLRVSEDFLSKVKQCAKEQNINNSEFMILAAQEKMARSSHAYQTKQLLLANHIFNLMQAYPDLNPEFKKAIEKELKNYEN